MKNLLLKSSLVLFSAFILSSCSLFPAGTSPDASTQTPAPVIHQNVSPSPDPEQQSIDSAQTDEELLLLLENMEDPSFGEDLDTLESGLR